MGIEIERKYLVTDIASGLSGTWRRGSASRIVQGYLYRGDRSVARIRVAKDSRSTRAWLTIKGPNIGATRPEFEYDIPVVDANQMMESMCECIIDKMRFVVRFEGSTWEVDEFYGENRGLVVAEIELDSEEQEFVLPPWVGLEVTGDARYYNSNLGQRPFSTW